MFNRFRKKSVTDSSVISIPAEAAAIAAAARRDREAAGGGRTSLPEDGGSAGELAVADAAAESSGTGPPPAAGGDEPLFAGEVELPDMVSGPVDAAPTPVAVMSVAEAAGLSLTVPQRTAIALLTSGKTRVAAAAAAGVSRMTLYRWLTDDPKFQAAFNAWQNDVRATASAQLLAATHDAVATVARAVRKGDVKSAWKLLDSLGVTTKPGKAAQVEKDDPPNREPERQASPGDGMTLADLMRSDRFGG